VIATNTRAIQHSQSSTERLDYLCRSREDWEEAIESMDKKLAKKLGA
jgi:hypothetical protein